MSLIVDASVATKWFAEEAGSAEARALAARNEALIAPEIIVAEVGNALWKKCRLAAITRVQAIEALRQLPMLFEVLHPCASLGCDALTLSLDFKHPIYDCFYVALALAERAPLVTADRRMHEIAEKARVEVQML